MDMVTLYAEVHEPIVRAQFSFGHRLLDDSERRLLAEARGTVHDAQGDVHRVRLIVRGTRAMGHSRTAAGRLAAGILAFAAPPRALLERERQLIFPPRHDSADIIGLSIFCKIFRLI